MFLLHSLYDTHLLFLGVVNEAMFVNESQGSRKGKEGRCRIVIKYRLVTLVLTHRSVDR